MVHAQTIYCSHTLGCHLPSVLSRTSARKATARMPWWEGKEELELMSTGTHSLSAILEWRFSMRGGQRKGREDREWEGQTEKGIEGWTEKGGRMKGRGQRKGEGRGSEGSKAVVGGRQ